MIWSGKQAKYAFTAPKIYAKATTSIWTSRLIGSPLRCILDIFTILNFSLD